MNEGKIGTGTYDFCIRWGNGDNLIKTHYSCMKFQTIVFLKSHMVGQSQGWPWKNCLCILISREWPQFSLTSSLQLWKHLPYSPKGHSLDNKWEGHLNQETQESNEDLRSMEVVMDQRANDLGLTWRTVEADAAGVYEWASQSGCHGRQAMESWGTGHRT